MSSVSSSLAMRKSFSIWNSWFCKISIPKIDLSVEVSAETALLLLVAAAHVGLDSVSVEADFDAVEVDADHVLADLLNSKI